MRGTPHIANRPEAEGFPHISHISSMTHPSRRAEQSSQPVFIGNSGWRRKLSRLLAVAVGCACVGYLVLVGMLIGGLLQPVGSQPPSTTGPLPAAPQRPVAGEPGPGPDRPVAGRSSPGPDGAQRIDAPRGGAER